MTGSVPSDCVVYLFGLVALIVGAVGRRLGWPILTSLADWLAKFVGKKDEPRPDEEPHGDSGQPQPVATLADDRPVQTVSAAAWLSFLLPLLWPLIKQLIAELEKRLGRQATLEEKDAVAEQVMLDYAEGRLRVYPGEPDVETAEATAPAVELADSDLEQSVGGKDVRAEALAAARKTGDAAEQVEGLAGDMRRMLK